MTQLEQRTELLYQSLKGILHLSSVQARDSLCSLSRALFAIRSDNPGALHVYDTATWW